MNTHMEKCLIILLNWNGSRDTLACCQSLLADAAGYDVLIIDNASTPEDYRALHEGLGQLLLPRKMTDDTCRELLESYQVQEAHGWQHDEICFTLLRSDVNHGFARGCNLGVRYAQANQYPQVLLLNNDTEVEAGFLPPLQQALLRADAVIPQIRFFDRRQHIWNCGGSISRFGKRTYLYANQHVADTALDDQEIVITFATGCCLLLRTHYFVDIGLFSEAFFFGEEDIDLSLRMKKLGARMVCVPQSLIYHKVGASLAGDNTRLTRKAYIHYLNRFVNMKSHLGLLWYLWLVPSALKVFINTLRINKLSLTAGLRFTWRLLQDAFSLNAVSREKFEVTLKKGY